MSETSGFVPPEAAEALSESPLIEAAGEVTENWGVKGWVSNAASSINEFGLGRYLSVGLPVLAENMPAGGESQIPVEKLMDEITDLDMNDPNTLVGLIGGGFLGFVGRYAKTRSLPSSAAACAAGALVGAHLGKASGKLF